MAQFRERFGNESALMGYEGIFSLKSIVFFTGSSKIDMEICSPNLKPLPL